jgi:hypothetical protein
VLAGFGLISGDSTTRAIAELLKRGLIVRPLKARPRHAALYGVSHMPLNVDAMSKAGARDPRSTPSDGRTENSDRPPDRETRHHRTELTQKQPNSVRPADRIRAFSASNPDRPSDQSKNLPCPIPGNGRMPEHLIALLDRIRAHGGTVTCAHDLRVRWWHGDPPADLAGELQVHAKELFVAMSAHHVTDGRA